MVLGWGKKAENNPDSDEEMSMEEILASIRKYVSTDQQTQPSVQQEQQPVYHQQAQYVPTGPSIAEEEVSPYKLDRGSDKADRAPSTITSQTARGMEPQPTIYLDHSYGAAAPQENTAYTYSQEPKPDYRQEIPSSAIERPVTVSMVSRSISEEVNASGTSEEADGLFSAGTMNATSQAFSKLLESTRVVADRASAAQNTPAVTLDQLMADLARPMIKSWVDQNLSKLIETMVAREIEKITKNMR